MLSIGESNDHITRRAMMTIGGLGFGGLTLANLLATKSQAAASSGSLTTGKSVIFLLQHGGPTQFETFDPKLDVPDAIRTVGGVTQTSVPGTIFGSAMPGLARHADKLAVVRSYSTGSGAHSNRPLITKASVDANIGSLYARFASSNDVESGLPTNVALYPNSIDPTALGPDERFGKLATTGDLGSAYTPFAPGGGSDLQRNMTLALPRNRFDDRRALLSSLDPTKATDPKAGGGTRPTPKLSASNSCWPAGCASPVVASSPSPPGSSGTCTPMRTTSASNAEWTPSFGRSIMPSPPSSKTAKNAASPTTFCSSPSGKWAAHRKSTNRADATTGVVSPR